MTDAPQALAALTQAQVPSFRTPESCADAIAAVFARRVPGPPASTLLGRGPGRTLSEAQAYGLLDTLGVPHAPFVCLAFDEVPADLPFGYPVAAKLCSPDILWTWRYRWAMAPGRAWTRTSCSKT